MLNEGTQDGGEWCGQSLMHSFLLSDLACRQAPLASDVGVKMGGYKRVGDVLRPKDKVKCLHPTAPVLHAI
jgi:hypothetical protein